MALSGISSSNQFQSSPIGQNQKSNNGEPPAELKQKLLQAGIPESTIAQGKEAVEAYAKEHNIKLPEPPQGPPQGSIMQNSGAMAATTAAGVGGSLDVAA